ncbi:MAG: shikimate kinase [Clostridia bacterium]|nr:shikimate kinase [Clostridia bacterium]
MNVVLCGMMGVGKSTVGKKLQWLSGKTCVDTDLLIVQKHGQISEIFEKYGEEHFRNLETQTVQSLAKRDNLIISTGGGLVLREQNVSLLKEKGKIFFLRASLQTLLSRVTVNAARPLLSLGAEQKLRSLLPVRTPVYERVADYIIDTDERTVDDIAREILSYTE